jgi:uncharacterized protein YjbJ (UPF0337 family)
MGLSSGDVSRLLLNRAAIVTPRNDARNWKMFGFVASGNTPLRHITEMKEIRMGLDDKIENKGEDLKGKAKEATGKATDDEDLEAEGKTDQTKSSLKDAKENVKDAFS